MLFRKFRKIHFIGIGGIGMSGIAEILHNLGFEITGSDLQKTAVTDRLESLGIRIYQGHSGENLGEAEVAVYSSAVAGDNSEVACARQRGIPVIRRAEMLSELMRMKFGIAVAGTHGKTTTTSMIGTVLEHAGMDPTVIVGGLSPVTGSNARLGKSEFLVVEADEFDRSFLKLTSTIAVITTLELEHLDCYSDMDDLKRAFAEFANKTPFFGTVILCIDEPAVRDLLPLIDRPKLTYGFDSNADIRCGRIEISGMKSRFQIYNKDEELGWAELAVLGRHNIKNALAATAAALELDIPFTKIVEGLKKFTGVKRRFEIKGEIGGVMVVDDYAHHPTETAVTLEAVRNSFDRRIIAVFQPHLYSRTRDFHEDFGKSFKNSDILILAPIYPAREKPLPGVSTVLIAEAARKAGHPDVRYIENKDFIAKELAVLVKPGDIVITMGAGDIWKSGEELCGILKEFDKG
ncbi:UDP-N-acetylmuramate--L-alanine ligase [bacterium]|nr:UDP-N-acetylmuramate--L-alanine ligase [bacterium]